MADGTTTAAGASSALFREVRLGASLLAHRIVMAPLTRMRNVDNKPGPLAIQYYGERATSGGLIIAEGMVVSANGDAYHQTPHMRQQAHADAWRPVVQAVHDKGGIIAAQLWHAGRVSHSEYQPDGQPPVSPSPIPVPPEFPAYTSRGLMDHPVPRELRKDELPGILQDHVAAAKLALNAGFDIVEVHCANGYLLDSFLKSNANQRTDEYGGSVDNRCRFPLEVIRAVAAAVGPERTGVRFSPWNVFGAEDPTHKYAVFTYLMEELSPLGLAYVSMVEPRVPGGETVVTPSAEYNHKQQKEALDAFRMVYKGTFMAAGGFTQQTGADAVETGHADLILYGRSFISNPDLVERFRLSAPLAEYDRNTFYTTAETTDLAVGYTDYPALPQAQTAKASPSSSCSQQSQQPGQGLRPDEGAARSSHLGNAY